MPRTKPGPEPTFTHRLNVMIRDDQHEALGRVAGLVHMSQSETVRWILDSGLSAIEHGHTLAKQQEEANGHEG